MFNPPHVYSAMIYDDIIANNTGCHVNIETLTTNTETDS